MPKPTIRSRTEAAADTRERLVSRARSLFAQRGYTDVGLSEIVTEAGVTKGALYHHFGSKADLFRAVLARVHGEVGERVAAAAETGDDPWDRLLLGCDAFLRASGDPVARRILLVDGPAVLGWSEWKALDAAASERHLTEAIEELVSAGIFAEQPIPPVVHLLSGAMNEAALWLAHSSGPDDIAATMRTLTAMLTALRRPGAE